MFKFWFCETLDRSLYKYPKYIKYLHEQNIYQISECYENLKQRDSEKNIGRGGAT